MCVLLYCVCDCIMRATVLCVLLYRVCVWLYLYLSRRRERSASISSDDSSTSSTAVLNTSPVLPLSTLTEREGEPSDTCTGAAGLWPTCWAPWPTCWTGADGWASCCATPGGWPTCCTNWPWGWMTCCWDWVDGWLPCLLSTLAVSWSCNNNNNNSAISYLHAFIDNSYI